MNSNPGIPFLQRPAFFEGQLLTSDDLAAAQQYHRDLRWLHNRSMHDWGIAFGYAVSGAKDDRAVHVGPGYAVDCLGRDIILDEPQALQVPAVASATNGAPTRYYLVAQYAEDEDLAQETRSGTCNTSGAVRREEAPLIRWKNVNDYRRGLDIVIGTVEIQNCKLARAVSGDARKSAATTHQPYVAAGQTPQGSTGWRLWLDPTTNQPVGVATTVVTTSAGFRSVPMYQAHVMGVRVFDLKAASAGQISMSIVDGYVQIAEPTAYAFELRMILPTGRAAFMVGGSTATSPIEVNPAQILTEEFMGRLQLELNWHVVWMGIEG